MRVSVRETNLAVVLMKLQVITHRLTTSFKLLSTRRNFSVTVMSLMARSRNVKRKLKLCSILFPTCRSGTRTTVISSCLELRELISNASKSWMTSTELPLRLSSANRESFNS